MKSADAQRELLRKNGFALSNTSGVSMRPLIWGGQHCVVITPLDDEPSPGDLLLFKQKLQGGSERNIVHRLIEIKDDEKGRLYVTRGDNCLGTERVRRDEIVGRVAEVHRTSGFRPWHIIPKEKFAVTDLSYRIYSRIWDAIWPLRRFCYRVRGKLRSLI